MGREIVRISPCSLMCWVSREEREGESRESRADWQGARERQEDNRSRSGGAVLREDRRLDRWPGDRENIAGTGQGKKITKGYGSFRYLN